VSERVIYKYPQLYKSIKLGLYFNWKKLTECIVLAIFQSLVMFIFYYFSVFDYGIATGDGLQVGSDLYEFYFGSIILLVVYYQIFIITS
jgi:magnesium-transporting ATPase (P-type)